MKRDGGKPVFYKPKTSHQLGACRFETHKEETLPVKATRA